MTPEPVKAAAMKAAIALCDMELHPVVAAHESLAAMRDAWIAQGGAIIERHYRELLAGQIADYEAVLADKRRLAREMDVAMHGEAGAAKQPALCDVLSSVRNMVAENARLRGERNQLLFNLALMHFAGLKVQCCWYSPNVFDRNYSAGAIQRSETCDCQPCVDWREARTALAKKGTDETRP